MITKEMINIIISIIGILLGIIIPVLKIKYIKRKYYRLRRRCIKCGYSRDDITNEWEICGINDKYIGYIRCQKCKTCQSDWKKRKK